MCGILAALGLEPGLEKNRRMMLRQSKLLRHRGPDANAVWQNADGSNCICFERLQIIDVTDGGRCLPIAPCCLRLQTKRSHHATGPPSASVS